MVKKDVPQEDELKMKIFNELTRRIIEKGWGSKQQVRVTQDTLYCRRHVVAVWKTGELSLENGWEELQNE